MKWTVQIKSGRQPWKTLAWPRGKHPKLFSSQVAAEREARRFELTGFDARVVEQPDTTTPAAVIGGVALGSQKGQQSAKRPVPEAVLKLAGTLAVVEHAAVAHADDPALQDTTMAQLRETQPCCAAAYNKAVKEAAAR